MKSRYLVVVVEDVIPRGPGRTSCGMFVSVTSSFASSILRTHSLLAGIV